MHLSIRFNESLEKREMPNSPDPSILQPGNITYAYDSNSSLNSTNLNNDGQPATNDTDKKSPPRSPNFEPSANPTTGQT